MNLTALIPVKKNSERVPDKNFRLFNGKPLFHWMMETLQQCEFISEILVNSDSTEVADFILQQISKGKVIDRPIELCGDLVTMNSLIAYDINQTTCDCFLQTHATNPMLSLKTINSAIQLYEASLSEYDSLLSVTKISNRLYAADGKAINHTNTKMQRTQDMQPVYEENSNLFIFSRKSFVDAGNSRVGLRPQLFEMDKIECMDIDYENDFRLAELIHRNKNLFPEVFEAT